MALGLSLAGSSGLRGAGGPLAISPSEMEIAEGFEVELVYTVPKEEQGSWVGLTVDERGRIIACDQYGGLYRVTLPAVAGIEEAHVERLELEGSAEDGPEPGSRFGGHGVLYAFGSLYVMVNEIEGKRGIWRLRDTDGNDRFDRADHLLELDGAGEHGPHSMVLSPDGQSIYFVAGNYTRLSDRLDGTRGVRWGEDHLLSRLWDPRGHAKGLYAPGGWVGRCNAEGGAVELFAYGFRNCFDIAFDANGELFTFDSDMEWDQGMPWYMPTRINHVVDGGDYGWRSGAGRWPAYYADSLPATVDIGPGSPTGTVVGTGARFPAKYQRAFFAADWTYGTLYAIHHVPDGASFRGEREEFISGKPLPLTDLVINPKDGAMYFAIGGRLSQSAVYRVTYSDDDDTSPAGAVEPTEEALLRRRLEALHTPGAGHEAVEVAWPHLGSADRFIRFAARVAIEHQPVSNWAERALEEPNPRAAVEALIALARVGPHRYQDRIIEALARIEFLDQDEELRLPLLRAWQLAFTRMGRPEADTRERLAKRFEPLFPQADPLVNRELLALLVYLESPDVVAKAVPLLGVDEPPAQTAEELGGAELIARNDRYGGTVRRLGEHRPDRQQIAVAYALREARVGWTPELRREYFRWFATTHEWKGGMSFNGFLQDMRAEALEMVDDAEEVAWLKEISKTPTHSYVTGSVSPQGPGQLYTVDTAAALVTGSLSGRDFKRGEAMFASTACIACHRFDGEGGGFGPDLTGAGNRYTVRDLLDSIIEPSKVISDQYQFEAFELRNGDTMVGRVVEEDAEDYHLMVNPFAPEQRRRLGKKWVVSRKPYALSMMPTGLINGLNPEELRDLVAYILSGGNADDAMFRREE